MSPPEASESDTIVTEETDISNEPKSVTVAEPPKNDTSVNESAPTMPESVTEPSLDSEHVAEISLQTETVTSESAPTDNVTDKEPSAENLSQDNPSNPEISGEGPSSENQVKSD